MAASLKEFQVNGPEWARGCGEGCQYGLILAPEPIPFLTLAEQRAAEADAGLLIFCDCRAGFMYRQYLRKVYANIGLTTRQNLHEHVMAAPPPTVHAAQPEPAEAVTP